MHKFIEVLTAALVIGIGLTAHAQQDGEARQQLDIPIKTILASTSRLNVQGIARQVLSPDQVQNLVETDMVLAVHTWQGDGRAECFAQVGPTSSLAKTTRRPFQYFWAMSEGRKGDVGMAACERAFQAAVSALADSDVLSLRRLQAGALITKDPAKPKFPKEKRIPGTVSHITAEINDVGLQLITDTLGPRWHKVLDHRKFAAYVAMLNGKTVEGSSFCLVEFGVAAISPEGVRAKYPSRMGAKWKVLQDKSGSEDCSRSAVVAAVESLRDNYPEMLAGFEPEAGVTYPSIAELQKQVAKYDAEQAKARAVPAASRTRSTNVLRCSNQCSNGSCVRTFEDGRKERWQAPRTFNPFTQNWEWDITTNACGR